MRVLLLVTLVVGGTLQLNYSPQQIRALFKEKLEKYRKLGVLPKNGKWSKSEEKGHFRVFLKFAEMVKKLNDKYDKKWKSVINQFSLMTPSERELYLGVKNSTHGQEHIMVQKRENSRVRRDATVEAVSVDKESVDWSSKLPGAKNQGGCGSCWIFGGVAPVEYQINKDKDTITSLSEQHFLDCVYEGGGDGCGGGWPNACWTWLQGNGNNAADINGYAPYIGRDGPCNTDTVSAMGDYKVIGYAWTNSGDEAVRQIVTNPKFGVISVLVMANGPFSSYGGGVFSLEDCYSYNHAVAVVGYGSDNGEKFWKVRNSWGSWWGENGYIRMKRGPGISTCGVATWPHVPFVTTEAEESTWYNMDETGKECIMNETPNGYFYRGTVSHTKSGLKCQNWLAMEPNTHTTTPQNNINRGIGNHNYCRNPDGSSEPWCYNGEGSDPVREACIVPFCECTFTTVSEGTQSATKSEAMELCEKDLQCAGVRCDGDAFCWLIEDTPVWKDPELSVYTKGGDSCLDEQKAAADDDKPCTWQWDVVVQGTTIYDSKDTATYQCEMKGSSCKGVTCESYNNCWLNMESEDAFQKEYTVYGKSCEEETVDGTNESVDDSSEYWDMTIGKECRESSDWNGAYYRGTTNQTISGLPCQKWTSQTPNGHSRTPELNAGKGLGEHDFCRNPDGEPWPWCYNGAGGNIRYEKCDVPVCQVCEWETEVEGQTTYNKKDALLACYGSGDCQAFTCRGDKDCWLNNENAGQSEKIMSVYNKSCRDA